MSSFNYTFDLKIKDWFYILYKIGKYRMYYLNSKPKLYKIVFGCKTIEIPVFDIEKYSIGQIEDKIKLYLLLS